MLDLNKYYKPYYPSNGKMNTKEGHYNFRNKKIFVEALEEASKKVNEVDFVMIYINPSWQKEIHLIISNDSFIPSTINHRLWDVSITKIRELYFKEMIDFLQGKIT